MIVMCSNSGYGFRDLHKRHPDKIGWLIGPSWWKNPWSDLKYALDNDAFAAWTNKLPWNESAWLKMLDKAALKPRKPLWALAPDVVTDPDATIEAWHKYLPEIKARGFPAAFAVQDGITPPKVPKNHDVLFVGGSTEWKWNTAHRWALAFPRVHVGRVRQTRLLYCDELGIESCDGTGWFREGQTGMPRRFLEAWLEGQQRPHPTFNF